MRLPHSWLEEMQGFCDGAISVRLDILVAAA
jgi:hypothetical protein